jgi:hypothetical protein
MNSGPSNTATALNSIRCNTLTNMFIGFDFESYNGASIWRNNNMQNLRRGLYLGNNGIIGQQGTSTAPSDNRWLGTWGSGNFNTFTDASFPINSILYNRNVATYVPTFNSNSVLNPAQVYGIGNGLVNNATGTNLGCATAPPGGGGCPTCREALLTDIAADNVTYSVNLAATKEINKNLVFTDITVEPALTAVNATLSTFNTTNNAPATFGKYKNIEQKLSTGQLALAQSLIAAFSPTTNIENNYKTFYTLQRAYLQNQDLTMLQNIQLLLLAYQCPFTDGQVVYNARALYNLVNQTAIVYNDFNCNALGFSFGRTASDSVKLSNDDESILMQLEVLEKQSVEKFKPFEKYTLYPNPATNYVTIVSNTNTENVHIQITDVNGKILISGAKAILNFETSLQLNLISGIYFVNITNDNGNKEVKKLVIVK